jgi:hypothetical protein
LVPSARLGAELAHDVGQVVGPVESFDDHTLDPQVVAPHLLDQLGVVDALDEDAAAAGHAGGGVHGDGAGRRAGGCGRGRLGAHERDRLAVDVEGAGPEPEQAVLSGPAADDHTVLLHAKDHAAEAGAPVLDLEARSGLDLRILRPNPGGAVDRS